MPEVCRRERSERQRSIEEREHERLTACSHASGRARRSTWSRSTVPLTPAGGVKERIEGHAAVGPLGRGDDKCRAVYVRRAACDDLRIASRRVDRHDGCATLEPSVTSPSTVSFPCPPRDVATDRVPFTESDPPIDPLPMNGRAGGDVDRPGEAAVETQRAGANERRAAVGMVAREKQRARACLNHVARAGNRAVAPSPGRCGRTRACRD